MDDVAICVRGVSKRYEVFDSQRARLLHAFFPDRGDGVQQVWALRDVGLEVRRGESVAIIGRNGSGKSTLLQILAGTLTATSGEVNVNARVSALLELGSGFNPEYSGRDNVIVNGLLLGLKREGIVARFAEIAAFADIGDAIDRPVKTYSSGMVMRLAFAVQVLTDPEILIVDEALSVGDFFFQQKCFGYIRSLVAKGVTLLFVSHDMGTVRDLCARAVYLKEGRVQFAGATTEAIRRFMAERAPGTSPPVAVAASAPALDEDLDAVMRDALWRRFPEASEAKSGQLIAVALYDAEGRPGVHFKLGETIKLKVAYRPAEGGAPTHVALALRNRYDQVVSSLGSSRLALAPPHHDAARYVVFEMSLGLDVEAGNYSLSVSLGRVVAPNRGEVVDAAPALGPVIVQWDYERDDAPFLGMVGLPASGSFRLVQPAASALAP